MKKATALILAILLAFSLVACKGNPAPSVSPSPTASPGASPAASGQPGASPSSGPVETGFFDPSVDYSKQKRYKVVYMMNSTGVLYDMFSKAFRAWAGRLNCDYSDWSAGGDNDLYLTTLETYASQGVDGFLLDPDSTVYPRLIDLMKDLKKPWMGGMASPIDSAGKLAHPSVGFDNTKFGQDMATWTINYAKTNWAGAKPTEIGMLSMDYSLSPEIHARTTGSQDIWNKTFPTATKNFIAVDGSASGKLDSDTGFNLAAPTMAAHPEIKYWLVTACIDDYADGAARAAEQAGKASNTVAITCGGSGLINHWDAGEDSCWKAAIYTAQVLYAEPIFNGLYAMMSGKTTAETLWPEWVNKAAGDTYATLKLPSYTITKDTYQEYMEWVDSYTGINSSNYSYKGTQFEARATPPASYAGT